MAETPHRRTSFPPQAARDCRVLVLGSMPGERSLAEARYYAHPQNQFWRLMGLVIGEELHDLPYEHRLGRLAAHRIGLWDVISSASRQGCLDQAIRNANHNRIEQLVHDFPDLQAIGFNGGKSAALGRKLISDAHGLALIDLPSSSPANTRPFAEKAAVWSRLAPYCGRAQNGPR